MLSNIKELSHNKAVLVVSHDLKLLEKYCDIIYELSSKKIKRII